MTRRTRARALSLLLPALLLGASAAHAITLPPGFEAETIGDGMTNSVSVDWAPDGRMFVGTTTSGLVHVFNPGATRPSATLDLPGAIYGIQLDVNFPANGYLYVIRTNNGGATQRLSRYTVGPDNRLAGAEKVLVGAGASCKTPPVEEDCMSGLGSHDAGTIRTDPRDGTIWFGNGDNSDPGYRQELFGAQDDLTLTGKILHVDREGRGLPNHPFCREVTDLTRPCTKVWAKGMRNPFRFDWRPDGRFLVADVGWQSREEVTLISTTTGGQNLGWPCYEGALRTPSFRDDPKCASLYALEGDPGGAMPPNWDYPHVGGDYALIGGPTYTGGTYPSDFVGDAFVADYGQGWVKRLQFDAQGRFVAVKPFATDAGPIVDLALTPGGDLALVDIRGKVVRIRSTSTNRAPVAKASASPTSGAPPLTVAFSSAGTTDPDNDPVSFEWDFGDGSARSTSAAPSHTYSRAGSYTARLTVRDPSGSTSSATVGISVGNTAPVVTIDGPATYRNGQTLKFTGKATDAEDGELPASALHWTSELIHNTHTHLGEDLEDAASLSFFAATDHDADSHYLVHLSARDAGGAVGTKTVRVDPETVAFAMTSVPAGAPLVYHGFDVVAPFSQQSAIGLHTTVSAAESFTRNGVRYRFEGWSDGGDRLHDVVIPDTPLTLTATYEADGEVAEDTVLEGEAMTGVTRSGAIRAVADPDAAGGAVANMIKPSALSATVDLPATRRLTVYAEGQPCSGMPTLVAELDGVQVLKGRTPGGAIERYSVPLDLPAGSHRLRILFQGDTTTSTCDRRLLVDRVVLSPAEDLASPAGPFLGGIEAEDLTGITATGPVQRAADASASGGAVARFLRVGKVSGKRRLAATHALVVRAAGEACDGSPIMAIRRNGSEVFRAVVPPGGLRDHLFAVRMPAGDQTIEAAYVAERKTTVCDRNLAVDVIGTYAAGSAPARTAWSDLEPAGID